MIKKGSELKKRYQFWKKSSNLSKKQKEEESDLIIKMLGGYTCECNDCDCGYIEE